MLSKEKMFEYKIYEICKNNEDVEIGEHFNGVLVANGLSELSNKPCTCIGKINDTERIFRSDDMLNYFSVRDGWGESDGCLAALGTGFALNFTTPTDLNGLKEFAENPPPAKSTNGAIIRQTKKAAVQKVLEAISEDLQETGKGV